MKRRKSYLRRAFIAEYNALKNAIHRCHSANSIAWENYGARGIEVAAVWHGFDGFPLFLDHIGPRPSDKHSLDRIDNNKGYEPGNVRWTDRKTQQNNTRPISTKVKDLGWGIGHYQSNFTGRGSGPKASALVEHEGRTMTLSEWARELDMKPATIRQRLQRGLSTTQAFDTNTSRKGGRRGPTIH